MKGNEPIFALASVKELRVVDLPLDGFPTIPMRGSLGMVVWHVDCALSSAKNDFGERELRTRLLRIEDRSSVFSLQYQLKNLGARP